MGIFFSKTQRHQVQHHGPIDQQEVGIDRQRSFSIHPEDWRDKDYRAVVQHLREKYPKAHVTTQAEKHAPIGLSFERPLSFQEGDSHIVVVYHATTERILGFYDASDPTEQS